MNLKYSDKKSEAAFTEALYESSVVQNWLINRLTGYDQLKKCQVTLTIGIDPWSKTDKTSYVWAIYKQELDDNENLIPDQALSVIINGGLIYRGKNEKGVDTYSSHT